MNKTKMVFVGAAVAAVAIIAAITGLIIEGVVGNE